jgi:DNA-binding CsgD family transcriptional regulator
MVEGGPMTDAEPVPAFENVDRRPEPTNETKQTEAAKRSMATPSHVEPLKEFGAHFAGAGLLLLAGSPLRPVYANAEAIEILAYPEDPTKILAPDRFNLVERKFRTVLVDPRFPHQLCLVAGFDSGRRHYLCRAFSLRSSAERSVNSDEENAAGRPELAVLMERGNFDLNSSRVAMQFHLTAREQETLHFLVLGLTNKDIANRMNVSPNTVKAFLRTIMIKTGSFTRSGIVGKCSVPHQATRGSSSVSA